MKSIRPIFCLRPLKWIVRKDWYSLERFGYQGIDMEWLYLIDFGMLTFGWAKKLTHDEFMKKKGKK